MTITIEVSIYKDRDRRRLNIIPLLQGVEWTGKKLLFYGPSLDAVYDSAELFYNSLCPIDLKRVRARMRHRLGRNGHGWPLTEKQKEDRKLVLGPASAALMEAANLLPTSSSTGDRTPYTGGSPEPEPDIRYQLV
jgi:hypothetical protein